MDAGVGLTTCSVFVTPETGTPATVFEFSGASNGSGCTASVDGGSPLSVACTGALTFPGSTFGVGDHEVVLRVASGPSGPTSCSARWRVTGPDAGVDAGAGDGGAPMTTCAIEVTPESGDVSTTFTAAWRSNGSSCGIAVDGVPLGPTPCDGTFSGTGAAIGAGNHEVALNVGDGPSGGTRCTARFLVTP